MVIFKGRLRDKEDFAKTFLSLKTLPRVAAGNAHDSSLEGENLQILSLLKQPFHSFCVYIINHFKKLKISFV
ncbi:MAG: hypothetical protein ACJAYJ_000049 [Saprospiraceae bacterium]